MKEIVVDKELLVRQYELYVQSTLQVTERRFKANQFYISLLSALLGVLTFTFGKDNFQNLAGYRETVLQAVCFLALLLNIIWFFTIRSYRKLNSAKFKVIHQMETQLPFQPYNREWEIIESNKYFLMTKIEQWLCLTLTLPFVILLLLYL